LKYCRNISFRQNYGLARPHLMNTERERNNQMRNGIAVSGLILCFQQRWRGRLSKLVVSQNALDGTKDDAVYVDDMAELPDDDMAMEEEFETDSEEDDD